MQVSNTITRAALGFALACLLVACGKEETPARTATPAAPAAASSTTPAAASSAASAESFVEGVHYERLRSPVPVSPPAGKVDVVEVFSYACHFCNDTEPFFRTWQMSEGAKKAVVSHVPATFNDVFALVARGYYAAEALGVLGRTHQKLFDAFFVEHKEVRSFEELAAVYEGLGVDQGQFLDAAQSTDVQAAYERGEQYQRDIEISGVPTFIVKGKYRVMPRGGGNYAELFRVIDFLVAKELGER